MRKFAIYETRAEAEAHKPEVEAHNNTLGGPRIINHVIKTWDGKYALTILAEGWGGDVVDTIERPDDDI